MWTNQTDLSGSNNISAGDMEDIQENMFLCQGGLTSVRRRSWFVTDSIHCQYTQELKDYGYNIIDAKSGGGKTTLSKDPARVSREGG
jgi:hypothetical protein